MSTAPRPAARLRPAGDTDRDRVLALNHDHVALLAPMDADRYDELRRLADRFDVIEVGGAFGGFVVTFTPGSAYDSVNYRWFSQRYDSFSYLDRVVLDPSLRRRGVGTAVYDELEAQAAAYGRMALEVNVEPPNEPSLAFHRSRGYAEVGRLGDPGHRVALLAKELAPTL